MFLISKVYSLTLTAICFGICKYRLEQKSKLILNVDLFIAKFINSTINCVLTILVRISKTCNDKCSRQSYNLVRAEQKTSYMKIKLVRSVKISDGKVFICEFFRTLKWKNENLWWKVTVNIVQQGKIHFLHKKNIITKWLFSFKYI